VKLAHFLVAAAALLVAAVCVGAGLWQLDRLEQRRERNRAYESAARLPPLELDAVLAREIRADPARFAYRRLTARGSYAPDGEQLLRGRAYEGTPGVHLLTPLDVEVGESRMPVLRGWLPAPDGATADPRPYRSAGPIVVEGLVLPVPRGAEPRPVPVFLDGDSVLTVRSVDLGLLSGARAAEPLPVLLQRLAGEAAPGRREPAPLPLPELTDGPHLGYAVQWFSFAALALLGPLFVFLRGRR
jgi:surfeit locus 1 family protein